MNLVCHTSLSFSSFPPASLQLTLTSATPSPAIEWFVGKVQFDFNDHRWGRAAVQQVDDLLALCTADDLAYLGDFT